jgi:restriction endonuclease Mrr
MTPPNSSVQHQSHTAAVQGTKRVSPNAVEALKDSLTAAFWFKSDLRGYLSSALTDPSLLAGVNWEDYKWSIVDAVISRMVAQPDRHHDTLVQLMVDVAGMNEFPKLRRHEDADRLIADARAAVHHLRAVVKPYERELLEREQARERIAAAKAQGEQKRAFTTRLEALKVRYLQLVTSQDPRARGYALEALLRDLFALFDLDPRAAFRIAGEQIDGAFALDSNNFLLEAKWHSTTTPRKDLDAFAAKIADKIENTLGLFITINGFDPTAVAKHSGKGSAMILMDGSDLYAVLESRVDLVDLLRRKYRYAAQTGDILLPVASVLGA